MLQGKCFSLALASIRIFFGTLGVNSGYNKDTKNLLVAIKELYRSFGIVIFYSFLDLAQFGVGHGLPSLKQSHPRSFASDSGEDE